MGYTYSFDLRDMERKNVCTRPLELWLLKPFIIVIKKEGEKEQKAENILHSGIQAKKAFVWIDNWWIISDN